MEKHRSKWIDFDEIMAFHPENREVYKLISENLQQLVPFVGAGLSVPFYPMWGESLRQIAGRISDEGDRKACEALIEKGRYLDAAECLSKKLGRERLNQAFAALFSPEKLEGLMPELRRRAVYLLPALFRGSVLTTNLDRILAAVYEDWNEPFTATLLPSERPSILEASTKEPKAHFLWALHGTVDGDYLEEQGVVFTRSQYHRHYRPWSRVVRALKKFYQRRPMLFLGASLCKDRTLKVLQRVSGRGTWHYAIVDVAPEQREEKLRALEKLHIRPILYPRGRFEAVWVLLGKLLEDSDPACYRELMTQMSEANDRRFIKRFYFAENLFSLVGRPEETGALWDFVCDGAPFRWWAIQGPGGSGKSRLAWDLTQDLPEGWRGHWLSPRDYEAGLSALSNPKQNTVYVAEDVQAWATELGSWIRSLAGEPRQAPSEEFHGSKIRILLVERTGGDWETRLRRRLEGSAAAQAAEYRWQNAQGFLDLQPMEEGELLELAQRYAEAVLPLSELYKREGLEEEDGLALLEPLRRLDPKLSRPIWLLFLTDAWLQGEDPAHWADRELLRQVLGSERTLLRNRLERYTGADRGDRLLNACYSLWRAVTLLPDCKPEVFLPEAWSQLVQAAERFGLSGPEALLTRLGLGERGCLTPMQPDLLGEFFLIEPTEDPEEDRDRRALLRRAWKQPRAAESFFSRIQSDFRAFLDRCPGEWSLCIPAPLPMTQETLLPYARLLRREIALARSASAAQAAAFRLEALVGEHSDDLELALEFAKGLFHLSNKQELAERVATMDRLAALAGTWPDNSKIAAHYAGGLVNLSVEQELEWCAVTVERLEALAGAWPNHSEIVLEYATGLANLSVKQQLEGCVATVERLEAMASTWPDNPEIAGVYAIGLYNLSLNQELEGRVSTAERLEALVEAWPEHLEIALRYATGLANLSFMQELVGCTATVERLEALAGAWPDNSELAQAYASGLLNLSNEQELDGRIATVDRLEALAAAWPEESEIALEYAKALYNLLAVQRVEEAEATFRRMQAVWGDGLSREPRFALIYGVAAFALFEKQHHAPGCRANPDGLVELKLLARQWGEDSLVGIGCQALLGAASAFARGDWERLVRNYAQFEAIYRCFDSEVRFISSDRQKRSSEEEGLRVDSLRYLPLEELPQDPAADVAPWGTE